ncbi:MAG: hypothetical protein ACI9U2_002065 [Bradymonadia bacterium]|jgi:hypothetical protein
MQKGIGKLRGWVTFFVCLLGACDDAAQAPAGLDLGAGGGVDAATIDAAVGAGGDASDVADAMSDALRVDAGNDASSVVVIDSGGDAAPDMAASDQGLPACDPPLSLTPEAAVVAAFGLQVFVAQGGTGDWRFDLVSAENGANIHPDTGAYLAGGVVGVDDTVVLTDLGCQGEARADIEVVPRLRLRPSEVTLASGDGFTFEVEGGSGAVQYRWINEGSGGALDDGQYTAGPTLGLDVIEAVDPATGLAARARIRVVANPQLTTDPPRL